MEAARLANIRRSRSPPRTRRIQVAPQRMVRAIIPRAPGARLVSAAADPLTAGLLPLSWLFRSAWRPRRAVSQRRCAARRCRFRSLSSATSPPGGTGKTPLVAWRSSRALREHGLHPGIVSGGYGRPSSATPRAVRPADDPAPSGDEPLLLVRAGSRSGSAPRPGRRGARVAGEQPGDRCDCQRRWLAALSASPDVEIVVVDGERGFGNGALLPAGPLREPLARREVGRRHCRQWRTMAQVTVVGRPGVSDAACRRALCQPRRRDAGAEAFRGQRVHAIAGIGNPERFFGCLRAWGWIRSATPSPIITVSVRPTWPCRCRGDPDDRQGRDKMRGAGRCTDVDAAGRSAVGRRTDSNEYWRRCMDAKLLEILVCPVTKGPLIYDKATAGTDLEVGPARLSDQGRHSGDARRGGAAARARRSR